jgi:hypothetical protein
MEGKRTNGDSGPGNRRERIDFKPWSSRTDLTGFKLYQISPWFSFSALSADYFLCALCD